MGLRLLTLLLKSLSCLPLGVLQRIGAGLGLLFWLVPNQERRRAEINLALCLPELDADERRRLLRRTLIENGKTLLEMPVGWYGVPERWTRLIRGEAEGMIREAVGRGRGVIIAAPHLGNWELGVHNVTEIAPVTVLYRPPRQQAMEGIITSGRGRMGATLVPTTASGVKALYAALKRGEMVAILPDQQPKAQGRGAGEFAPFFGHPALTMVLVNRLARQTGAVVVFSVMARRPDGGFDWRAFEAEEGIADADAVVAAAALNRGVERCVRMYPEQYQWTYKRFDARPDGGTSPYARRK